MAKIFTITEGLENLGALKTGGQGSVYKGKRIGPIITAIKILPTPVYSESADDKNFISFQNEVQKLKKVNEHPNPNVVTILDSGITDSGNFPFIEMEFIEGPDLGELLKPPHEPVFTIKETIKVAEQISNALAHCHSADVTHGDIKSNNIKFNRHTGNYILLDFGLSVMSDEQRRTSFRHAGAIEFMAPEQNEGSMFFETDVYSFGVTIFELLAGTVPFPLRDGGETSRNTVMVAHMEESPADLLSLRRLSLPEGWNEQKRLNEMQVPKWLTDMVYKCLEKKPADRFSNGNELHEHIILQHPVSDTQISSTIKGSLTGSGEKSNWPKVDYSSQSKHNQLVIDDLRTIIKEKEDALIALRGSHRIAPGQSSGVSMNTFITLLILTLALAGYAGYKFWQERKNGKPKQISSLQTNGAPSNIDTFQAKANPPDSISFPVEKSREINEAPAVNNEMSANNDSSEVQPDNSDERLDDVVVVQEPSAAAKGSGFYTVVSIAHLHDAPDERSRRSAFITRSNGVLITSLDDQNGFIYVEFKNDQGQTTRGWLQKKDLRNVDD